MIASANNIGAIDNSVPKMSKKYIRKKYKVLCRRRTFMENSKKVLMAVVAFAGAIYDYMNSIKNTSAR